MSLEQVFTIAAQHSLPVYLTFPECQELHELLDAEETLSEAVTPLAAELASFVATQSTTGGETGSKRYMAGEVKALKAQLF